MRLRHFVTGVSAVLMGWLAVSYFHEVPVKRVAPVTPVAEAGDAAENSGVVEVAPKSSDLTVSVSP